MSWPIPKATSSAPSPRIDQGRPLHIVRADEVNTPLQYGTTVNAQMLKNAPRPTPKRGR